MILDGKKTAEVIKNEIKSEIEKNNYQINLATVLVGDDPASKLYIRNKKKACDNVGINIFIYDFFISIIIGMPSLSSILYQQSSGDVVHLASSCWTLFS